MVVFNMFFARNMNKFLFIALLMIVSCKKDNTSSEDIIDTKREMIPVVFVHGFLASSDTYEKQMLRFASNGYPMDLLYAYDWNTLNFSEDREGDLDRYIDEVLASTGYQQVDLVGHSAGAGLVFDYCKRDVRAKKVRILTMLAGVQQPGSAGSLYTPVPTLNIYSLYDKIVALSGNVNGAKNVNIPKKDHYQVATSLETFQTMYEVFRGEYSSVLDITEQTNPTISGKVLSFGENISGAGALLEIFEVNPSSGERLKESPDFSFTIEKDNSWGPIQVKSGAYYEFRVSTGKSSDRPVHYYREPFVRDNKNVVIRYYPPSGSLASLFLTQLPNDDNRAVNGFFGASEAVIFKRDTLKVNDQLLSIPQLASEGNTTIAMFMYDENNNQKSEVRSINAFSAFPFLAGVDITFPVGETSRFVYNGRVLNIKNWPSATEGVSIAVFD